MSDLVEGSIDILMIENPERLVSIEIKQDYIVKADFELFILAMKNLLDNAIKYSTDKHVTVTIDKNSVAIINKGAVLSEALDNYFKPFHTSKSGLGLGIYIVKSILDIHKMELEYDHKDGMNIFTIL